MNKVKQEITLLKEQYTLLDIIKSITTGFIFFIFPTLIVIGLLIVLGTVYPYWNMEFLITGSVLAFLYGGWTNHLVIQTLDVYHENKPKELILFALLMQFSLLLAIIIVDIIVITTIF
jgi:hypothetical protein